MLKITLKELIAGNRSIVDYYLTANEKWEEILSLHEDDDLDALAKEMGTHQIWFELNCGGKLLGQEIMVAVGIGRFYDVYGGFDDEGRYAAIRIAKAIDRSMCSVEVKYAAKDVVKSYGLELDED